MDPRITELTNMFKDRSWFESIGHDTYGRLVVYVKEMNQETVCLIPNQYKGAHILTHFAASKNAKADDFKVAPPKQFFNFSATEFIQKAKEAQSKGLDVGFGQMLNDDPEVNALLDEMEELDSHFLEVDMSDLHDALRKLEKMCPTSVLSDIFFEVHDGKNAVTDMSLKYPDVAKRLQELYDEYGFDVLYEELEL